MKRESKSEAELTLRQKAEKLVNTKTSKNVPQYSQFEAMKLVHELEVHQIELEMQNEALELAKEKAAELATEKYAELYDFAPSGYFSLSKAGDINELNLYGAQMLGKERSMLKKRRFSFFVSDDTRPVFYSFLGDLFSNKIKETCEITLWAEGNPPMYAHLTGIATDNGTQCLVTVVDITEITLARKALQERERFLKDAQMIARLGTYSVDLLHGKWISSEVLDLIFGIDDGFDKSVEGWVSILHPEYQIMMKDYFLLEVVCGRNTFDKEFKIIRQHDKEERWVHGIGRLECDKNNLPISMVGTIRDITEQKRAEKALRESEERQRFILESLPIAIYSSPVDADFDTTWISGDIKDITGYEVEEYLSEKDFWRKRLHPEDREMVLNEFANFPVNGEAFLEYRWKCKDGQYRWFIDRALLLDKDAREEYLGVIVDINERKKAEEALKVSEAALSRQNELFSLLLKNLQIGVFMVEAPSGKPLVVNEMASKLLGRGILPDASRHNLAEVYKAFKKGSRTPYPPEEMPIQLGINGKSAHVNDMMVVRPDGTEIYLEIFGSPVIDNQGHIWASLVSFFDITERKRVEEEIQFKNAELQKKDAEKDKFFSIIAHDLRGPFSGFLGLTEIMAESLPLMTLEEIQPMAIAMRNSASNLFRLLGNLLEWSRMQRGLTTFCPVVFLLLLKISESSVLAIDAAKTKNISVSFDIPENIEVFADIEMASAIIRNLLTNAVKFTRKGGNILVSAKPISGDRIEISVKDTG
ncbi:MAG: PAS domain S-box protein, partial [Mariniphaga sp.]|nr:PAS domain S-box protein [Mariniphaga sp.]